MDPSIQVLWGLIVLLIGAGLLTRLPHDPDQVIRYELGRKKKGRKKRRKKLQHQVSVYKDELESDPTNAPLSVAHPADPNNPA
ncbi:hypothetical protein [Spirosoma luteum]|uniref:hypothetical protein n=1 Tax=Spirosoma luteum TaxID=431553 RepID=UPI00036A94AF|nr:hypothetical protein [Spirosoma luteum]